MAKISKSILAAAAAMLAARDAGTLPPTNELLDFHNTHAERFGKTPVKRFPDRATAERRAAELAQAITDTASAPPPERKAPGETGAAVAASWADPATRAARSARYAVRVGKETYASVLKAFTALGLEVKAHAKFRSTLVKAGAAEFGGHKFTVVRDAA
jgi:hypothetical protein